jgi:hypothetical protein
VAERRLWAVALFLLASEAVDIDKQTVARRLIHSAIHSVLRQDDPLAAHVLIVGAFDLLRQYAKTKGIELRSDFLA